MHDQEELILEHLDLVRKMARKLAAKLGGDPEEFEADGVIGLIEAARRYNPAKSNNFAAFASSRIRGAMLDGFRSLDTLGRYERDMQKKDPKRKDKTGHLIHSKRVDPEAEFVAELMIENGDQIAALEKRYLSELLEILPPNLKQVMVMYYGEQMTYLEIGARLKKSESGICLYHRKAIELIQAHLRERGFL